MSSKDKHTNRGRALHGPRGGVALLTALSLLLLFSFLGMVYIRYMEIENERTDFEVRQERARNTAASGVYAAIAEIQAALRTAQTPGQRFEFQFPVYSRDRQAASGFAQNDDRLTRAEVTVADESGKINLNHAPAAVLQAVLGVPEAGAAKIVQSLPAGGDPNGEWIAGGDRTWLFSADDMVARGLLDQNAAQAIDDRFITFLSVGNHKSPNGYLNVNVAPPRVMAAALGVSADTARAVAAARPFSALAEVSAAAGKAPAEFPLPADALGFTSRCFRIVSAGSYANVYSDGREHRVSRRRVEAVVTFDEQFEPHMTLWHETAGEDAPGAVNTARRAEPETLKPAGA